MLGKFLSGVVKVVTLPISIVESVGDVLTDGDGSAQSKRHSGTFPGQDIIDGVCNGLESIDKK